MNRGLMRHHSAKGPLEDRLSDWTSAILKDELLGSLRDSLHYQIYRNHTKIPWENLLDKK